VRRGVATVRAEATHDRADEGSRAGGGGFAQQVNPASRGRKHRYGVRVSHGKPKPCWC
jgi:hypothetical protein